jgi:tetratricopeptide (TPR) repeat protein
VERTDLRLIVSGRRPEDDGRHPGWALAATLTLVLCAIFASASGADEIRTRLDPRKVAETTVQRALERGNRDPEVRAEVLDLRRVLGRSPLDSRTRVIYAGLLLNLCRNLDDTRAAAFHAGRAAELAPVTVPIVRGAVHVLVRTGNGPRALALVRGMFDYDPTAAAGLLAAVEPLLLDVDAGDGLAHTPVAWLAWAAELQRAGRNDEAESWLERAHDAWPDDLAIVQQLASRALYRGDLERLAAILPAGLDDLDAPEVAPLLTFRARLKAGRGDRDGARRDVDRALALRGDNVTVQMLAGDAYLALGDPEAARRVWNRARYALAGDDTANRRALLRRLARLEHDHGEPAVALGLWRALLEIAPDDPEARERIAELTGTRY